MNKQRANFRSTQRAHVEATRGAQAMVKELQAARDAEAKTRQAIEVCYIQKHLSLWSLWTSCTL